MLESEPERAVERGDRGMSLPRSMSGKMTYLGLVKEQDDGRRDPKLLSLLQRKELGHNN